MLEEPIGTARWDASVSACFDGKANSRIAHSIAILDGDGRTYSLVQRLER
jgi:hypothetical protein